MELCIEIFMEEIPARMQRQAKIDFLQLLNHNFQYCRYLQLFFRLKLF